VVRGTVLPLVMDSLYSMYKGKNGMRNSKSSLQLADNCVTCNIQEENKIRWL